MKSSQAENSMYRPALVLNYKCFYKLVFLTVSCIFSFHVENPVESNPILWLCLFILQPSASFWHTNTPWIISVSAYYCCLTTTSQTIHFSAAPIRRLILFIFCREATSSEAELLALSARLGAKATSQQTVCLFIFGEVKEISSEREKWVTASLRCVIVESIASAALPSHCQQSSRRQKTSSEVWQVQRAETLKSCDSFMLF